jgi:hypothetical protein
MDNNMELNQIKNYNFDKNPVLSEISLFLFSLSTVIFLIIDKKYYDTLLELIRSPSKLSVVAIVSIVSLIIPVYYIFTKKTKGFISKYLMSTSLIFLTLIFNILPFIYHFNSGDFLNYKLFLLLFPVINLAFLIIMVIINYGDSNYSFISDIDDNLRDNKISILIIIALLIIMKYLLKLEWQYIVPVLNFYSLIIVNKMKYS